MSERQRKPVLRAAGEDERSEVAVRVHEPASGQTTIIQVSFTGGLQSDQLRAAATWLDEHRDATALSMSVYTSDDDEMVLAMFADDGIYRP
ncbi:hypothetical protein [Amycolatopsis australiensis]|uniref:Uncharacterized protein n=1 Tax=Amycolatopsis australiensis TaxID=546364 RepID=A0A1K1LKV5_9PSEU|nr:hypothetical protein [Amycolatopsis australiensis]SFW11533.1 hypothetical protein SAMN04489730_0029 [Amycolatopsis australiensis]